MNKPMKLLGAVLLLCLAVGLSACGGTSEPKPQQNPTETTIGGVLPSRPQTETEPENDPSVTQPEATEETTGPEGTTAATEPESTQSATTPEQETTPVTSPELPLSMSYSQYMALTTDQQNAFFEKHFATDPLGFHNWFQKVKAEHETENPEIEATGPVDLEDYIKPAP